MTAPHSISSDSARLFLDRSEVRALIIQQLPLTGDPVLEAVDALPIFNADDLRTPALSSEEVDEKPAREPTPHWERRWPHDQPNGWNLDGAKFLALVQANPMLWLALGRAKYLEMRIDTRDGGFNLYDRDGKPLNPDDVVAAAEKSKANFGDASSPTPQIAGDVRRWRHRKRGTIYSEVARGLLQTADAGGLTDNELMVVYRNDETGTYWVRDATEFEDGRFEPLSPQPQIHAPPFSRWADTIEAASLTISPKGSEALNALAAEVRAGGAAQAQPEPTVDELGGWIEHSLAYGISSKDGRTSARNLLNQFEIRPRGPALPSTDREGGE